jgi:hypothetical protein
METNKPTNTLAIIGLVLGLIALIFSFITCVGTIAFIPGIVGAILGVIAFLKAKDNGHPKGLAIATIVVSVIACIISVVQIVRVSNMASDMKGSMIEYTNCEDLAVDYKKVQSDMKVLTQEMESDNTSLSNITKIAKMGFKLEHIQEQSDILGCDINIEDMDLEGDSNEDMDMEGDEGSNEGIEMEDEDGEEENNEGGE